MDLSTLNYADAASKHYVGNQHYAELYMAALGELDASPDVAAQLSYVGHFYMLANKVAAAHAAAKQGMTFADLVRSAVPVIEQVLALVKELFPHLVDEIAKMVGDELRSVGDELGSAIPLIGAIIKGVVDIYLAIATADERDAPMNAEHCREMYIPPAPGTGAGGDVYPCDLVHGSLGDLLELAIGGGRFEGGMYQGRKLKGDKGIPARERRLLLAMLWSIRNSRNARGGDGGVSLWPIFLDLLWSQHELGRIGLDGVYYRYCTTILWRGPSPGWCCEHNIERRAFDEFKDILRRWRLTIDPIYAQDRAEAAHLRAALAVAEGKLLDPGPGDPFGRVQLHVQIVQRLAAGDQHAATSAVAQLSTWEPGEPWPL